MMKKPRRLFTDEQKAEAVRMVNSVAESFFGTLKTELIHPRIFSTRALARTVIAEWIEVFYNR
jgi:transposase InsO family protein